ncbi:uncharacterized protein LOC119909308 [Micropterus salmoides]|uniref:uncharacterized protein LOC119909308 n=1 Tax=Micropterus salmoides TaxID=27706 RepID=UPI0018EE4439|nr:uncharacterized protein LOC119909308 [Micropterus salmoides]
MSSTVIPLCNATEEETPLVECTLMLFGEESLAVKKPCTPLVASRDCDTVVGGTADTPFACWTREDHIGTLVFSSTEGCVAGGDGRTKLCNPRCAAADNVAPVGSGVSTPLKEDCVAGGDGLTKLCNPRCAAADNVAPVGSGVSTPLKEVHSPSSPVSQLGLFPWTTPTASSQFSSASSAPVSGLCLLGSPCLRFPGIHLTLNSSPSTPLSPNKTCLSERCIWVLSVPTPHHRNTHITSSHAKQLFHL